MEAGGEEKQPRQIPWPPPGPGDPRNKAVAPAPKRHPLTAEELKALKECGSESFWYRCVPLAAVLAGAVHVGVMRGFLKPNPRFGPLPKVMGAIGIGYLFGKFSYQSKCREKIMKLENSPLAEAMRQGKRGTELLTEITAPSAAQSSQSGGDTTESYPETSRPEMSGHLNMDTDRRQNKGLDDNLRPTIDREVAQPSASADSKFTTYEELRRRNREEYLKKIDTPRGPPPSPKHGLDLPPPVAPSSSSMYSGSSPSYSGLGSGYSDQPPDTQSLGRTRRPRTNQYGDVIED